MDNAKYLKELGARVRARRKELDYTQADVAASSSRSSSLGMETYRRGDAPLNYFRHMADIQA